MTEQYKQHGVATLGATASGRVGDGARGREPGGSAAAAIAGPRGGPDFRDDAGTLREAVHKSLARCFTSFCLELPARNCITLGRQSRN